MVCPEARLKGIIELMVRHVLLELLLAATALFRILLRKGRLEIGW